MLPDLNGLAAIRTFELFGSSLWTQPKNTHEFSLTLPKLLCQSDSSFCIIEVMPENLPLYSLTEAQVLNKLSSRKTGLSFSEAEERLTEFGPNQITQKKKLL